MTAKEKYIRTQAVCAKCLNDVLRNEALINIYKKWGNGDGEIASEKASFLD